MMMLTHDLELKEYFSPSFKSLLEGMLDKNPNLRLTIPQIKAHKFFKDTKWDQVLACT